MDNTPMCINCLTVHSAAPEHSVVNSMSMHARKSIDRERARGFTMQLYTGYSFPPVKQMTHAGACWTSGAVYS